MVQSVELLLDDAAENAIRAQWHTLADAALPHQRADHRPHITMAVAREIWPRVEKRLEHLEFAPFRLKIGALTVFSGRRPVLVRVVLASDPLLALHRQIHDVVTGCPGTASNMQPGQWTPHVTLARRLYPDQVGPAIGALLQAPEVDAVAAGIRRWDGEARREWPIA